MKRILGGRSWALSPIGALLIAAPASATVYFFTHLGEPLDPSDYDGEPCFTETIELTTDLPTFKELRVNPSGLNNDGNPETFLVCRDLGNNTIRCMAAGEDGLRWSCNDGFGPHILPEENDRVTFLYDIDPLDNTIVCDVVVERAFGDDNPNCQSEPTGTGGSGSGGSTGTGGSSSGVCDATTAQAVLSHGQNTTLPNDSCIHLALDPTWSRVNPTLQSMPGTTSYPVPFSYTSCEGAGTGALVGNYHPAFVLDGQARPSDNPGCDVFVQLEGDGAGQVNFTYWN